MHTVHILATCRNAELFDATVMVFHSIRIGFPTSKIIVTGNQLDQRKARIVESVCGLLGDSQFINFRSTTHWDWITGLIASNDSPFFICDTDVVFHSSVEDFYFCGPMHGREIPEFYCPLTSAVTEKRLHTAFLYIDPGSLKAQMQAINKKKNSVPGNPFRFDVDFVKPTHHFRNGVHRFHDTMSMAFHAFGGNAFPDDILDSYDHVNSGTYLDVLDKVLPGSMERQLEHIKNPAAAKGLWRQQREWYEQRNIASIN